MSDPPTNLSDTAQLQRRGYQVSVRGECCQQGECLIGTAVNATLAILSILLAVVTTSSKPWIASPTAHRQQTRRSSCEKKERTEFDLDVADEEEGLVWVEPLDVGGHDV